MTRDWDLRADELAGEAIGRGEPTAWFDRLYAEGVAGDISVPWDRDDPNPQLAEWAESVALDGAGRGAVVVGCGLGADAEYVASRGFDTTAFDIAPAAIEEVRRRRPESAVAYRVDDLLDLSPDLVGRFDLVVEVFTLQALPDPPRADAAEAVVGLVAPGGRLVAVAFRDDGSGAAPQGPPFPLGRRFMERLGSGALELARLDERPGPRWIAEYHRPG
ncbi:MAG TPA: methyltransferase [Nocardioides sp.]|nr:methyltransferase [Nocardioides sp.]